MDSIALRMICRLLVIAVLAAPFPPALAGMIGTQDALAAASAQADRQEVLNALNRTDIASQLQAQGVDPEAAKARLAAMTDSEASALASQIGTGPAGAHVSGWAIAIVVALVVWYFYAYR